MTLSPSSAVAWWAASSPERIAIAIDSESLNYREYDRWSDRVAARLTALGLNPGDRVAACSRNRLEYCVLAIGAMRAGCVLVPINLRFTAREAAEVIDDTAPRLIFVDDDHKGIVEGAGVPLLDLLALRDWRRDPEAKIDRSLDPDAPVVIITTSGSTARPKGVVLTNRSTAAYATEFALKEPRIGAGSRVLVLPPLSTAAGYVQLTQYSCLGATLFFASPSEPAKALKLLTEERINALGGVPILFDRIAALPGFEIADLSDLTYATVGGAAVSDTLLRRWLSKGITIRQGYGQSEAGGTISVMPHELAPAEPHKCGSGGPFTDLTVVREDGETCSPGEVGQILIRGPSVMAGYWNNSAATAATLREGWLHSGDLGVLDEHGRLTFVDRMKDIIISGGLNISAAEIERVLCGFEGIEEAAVIPTTDAVFGETPLAVVYAQKSITAGALIEHCNSQLADYKVPRFIIFAEDPLPRLGSGKIAKVDIRSRYKDASAYLERVR